MTFNNSFCAIFVCCVAIVSTNINTFPINAFLEIFESICAAADDDMQIRCTLPIPAAHPKTFLTNRIPPHKTSSVRVILSFF